MLKSSIKPSWFSGTVFLLILVCRWQVLQILAWCWMLVSYTLKHGIAFALRETFSGNFPCPLCHLVNAGQGAEAGFWAALIEHPFLLIAPLAVISATTLAHTPKAFRNQ